MLVYSQSLIKRLGSNLCHYILKDTLCRSTGVLLLETAKDYDPEFICIATPLVCKEVLEKGKSGYLICAGYSDELCKIKPDNNISFFVTNLDMIPLANLLNKFFRDHSGTASKENSFQALFSKIISSSADSDDSLMMALKNLPKPPLKHLRLILVRSEIYTENDGSDILYSLLEPVKKFFPNTNIALMPDEIVILLSSEIQHCPIEFSKTDFEKLFFSI